MSGFFYVYGFWGRCPPSPRRSSKRPSPGLRAAMLWGSLRCPASVLEKVFKQTFFGTPAASLGPPGLRPLGRLSPPRRSAIANGYWFLFANILGLLLIPIPHLTSCRKVTRETHWDVFWGLYLYICLNKQIIFVHMGNNSCLIIQADINLSSFFTYELKCFLEIWQKLKKHCRNWERNQWNRIFSNWQKVEIKWQ